MNNFEIDLGNTNAAVVRIHAIVLGILSRNKTIGCFFRKKSLPCSLHSFARVSKPVMWLGRFNLAEVSHKK